MSYCGNHDEYTQGCDNCEWRREVEERDAKVERLTAVLEKLKAGYGVWHFKTSIVQIVDEALKGEGE